MCNKDGRSKTSKGQSLAIGMNCMELCQPVCKLCKYYVGCSLYTYYCRDDAKFIMSHEKASSKNHSCGIKYSRDVIIHHTTKASRDMALYTVNPEIYVKIIFAFEIDAGVDDPYHIHY